MIVRTAARGGDRGAGARSALIASRELIIGMKGAPTIRGAEAIIMNLRSGGSDDSTGYTLAF